MKTDSMESDRVRRNTSREVNQKIDDEIRRTVERFASAPENLISQRIGALDVEWDIERVLETNASSLALSGVLLAARGHSRGLWLTTGVLGFLLLHATKGWCPPLPLLRRMGVRTRREIERERFVLKYLRGDFDGLTSRSGREAPAEVLASAAT